MCALALGVIGQALVSGGPTLASLWAGTRWGKVLVVVGLLLVYGVGFEAIGFIPCTLALLLVLMWFVDPVDWWLALIIAVRRHVRRVGGGDQVAQDPAARRASSPASSD